MPDTTEAAGEPVTTVTLRTVRVGLEEQFEKSLRGFFERSRAVPGQLAIHVVKPMPGSDSREWGILRTFRDPQARDAFFESELFQEWQAQSAPLMEGDSNRQQLCGLEAWFSLPGARAVVPPPRWKMALTATMAGTFSGTVLNLALGKYFGLMPGLLRPVVVSFCIASTMTYLVMPWLTRWLHGWLFPRRSP